MSTISAPRSLRDGDRLVEGGQHAGLDALAGELAGHAEPDAAQVGRRSAAPIGSGNASEVESHGSSPTIAANSSAASVTSRVNGPAWSSEEAKAIIP